MGTLFLCLALPSIGRSPPLIGTALVWAFLLSAWRCPRWALVHSAWHCPRWALVLSAWHCPRWALVLSAWRCPRWALSFCSCRLTPSPSHQDERTVIGCDQCPCHSALAQDECPHNEVGWACHLLRSGNWIRPMSPPDDSRSEPPVLPAKGRHRFVERFGPDWRLKPPDDSRSEPPVLPAKGRHRFVERFGPS